MTDKRRLLEGSAFAQLVLFRLRFAFREPQFLFWLFGFPLLTTVGLGFAFSRPAEPQLRVALVGQNAPLESELRRIQDLTLEVSSLEQAQRQLQGQALELIVVAGEPPTLLHDSGRVEGRAAVALVSAALSGQPLALSKAVEVRAIEAPRQRYIDFLVPGLIGWNLLGLSLTIITTVTVHFRAQKLMKRLAATPMSRSSFLGSLIVARALLALAEIAVILLVARLLFGVGAGANYALFFLFALLGTLSTSGLALLLGSRAPDAQAVNGLVALVNLGMVFLSGVFFSSTRFPDWAQPLIQLLPLTALVDGLRAILLEGHAFSALWSEVGILAAWGIVSFGLALKLFRWQ